MTITRVKLQLCPLLTSHLCPLSHPNHPSGYVAFSAHLEGAPMPMSAWLSNAVQQRGHLDTGSALAAKIGTTGVAGAAVHLRATC